MLSWQRRFSGRERRGSFFVCLLILLYLLNCKAAFSSDDDCLTCHADQSLFSASERRFYVDPAELKNSVHGRSEITCTDCHQDLADISDFPHAEELLPAACTPCHEDILSAFLTSSHSKSRNRNKPDALNCLACHGRPHNLISKTDVCQTCHQQVADLLAHSGHGAQPAACVNCHGAHSLKALKPASLGSCETCHPQQAEAYAAGPHGQARFRGKIQAPDCAACHGGTHSVTKLAQARSACQNCHPGRAEQVESSVHGRAFAPEGGNPSGICYQCHTGHQVYQQKGGNRATCGGCHRQIEIEYEKSLHGYALAKGLQRAPDCTSCHNDHLILPAQDPESPINRRHIHKTCGKCHGEVSVFAEGLIRLPRAAWTYATSVHGQAMNRGLNFAATCLDCHGDHTLKGAGDPTSSINILNIQNTCGKCHPQIQKEYQQSIHGRALQAGITDSPTCTGCHGEHQILSPENPSSPTSAAQQAEETCARCHNSPAIINKYGLEGSVVKTYEDSYHGLAIQGKSQRAATCSACHTSHNIQPRADSASTVHAANVVKTCARCHPGATVNFARSYTHASLGRLESPINAFIRNLYIFLIVFIIGGMILHNLIILNWHIMRAKKLQETGPTIPRFSRWEVAQHLTLTVAFIGLVITGFALKFTQAWWVKGLSFMGMDEELRSVSHRSFAVLMIATGTFHVVYTLSARRGREILRALLPNLKDARDVWDSLLFHLNIGKRKPQFQRYDYSQKGEYWALIWGTLLMALSGFILWFPITFLRFLPSWAIEVAQTIHYYEAWLATLAIIVWHFFFVIFHPEMYPMSWTWLTGKMNVRDVREHHPLWYEELLRRGVIKSETPESEAESDKRKEASND